MQNNSFSVLFFIYFLDTNVEGSTDGLLAYWKFNEGNGKTIKDHSGNGNTLEAEKGNPTWVSVALPEKKIILNLIRKNMKRTYMKKGLGIIFMLEESACSLLVNRMIYI